MNSAHNNADATPVTAPVVDVVGTVSEPANNDTDNARTEPDESAPPPLIVSDDAQRGSQR